MELRSISVAVAGVIGVTGMCGGVDRPPKTAARTACVAETERVPLPRVIGESSGVARSADGGIWTHNDGSEARLYRVSEGGTVEQTVVLENISATDIEDVDAGPCPGGARECLWLADTGDNDGERAEVAVLAVPVPAPGTERAAPARFAFRYPNGPRDAEALAVLPSGEALLITKGRHAPIELYRVPVIAPGAAAGTLGFVARLARKPERNSTRVTGAGASEDGAWIAVRSNASLTLHRTATFLEGDARPALEHDLRPLRESQGEGVDMTSDGVVWLTSEGEGGATPLLARLRCTLPE